MPSAWPISRKFGDRHLFPQFTGGHFEPSLLPIALKRTFLNRRRKGIIPWSHGVQTRRQCRNLLAMLAFGEDDDDEQASHMPEFKKLHFLMIGNTFLAEAELGHPLFALHLLWVSTSFY
jgi:hypothetical protein